MNLIFITNLGDDIAKSKKFVNDNLIFYFYYQSIYSIINIKIHLFMYYKENEEFRY